MFEVEIGFWLGRVGGVVAKVNAGTRFPGGSRDMGDIPAALRPMPRLAAHWKQIRGRWIKT
jgi:hypothetical protein